MEHRLKEQFDEITLLTRMVRTGEDANARLRHDAAQELGAAVVAMTEGGRLASLLPRRLRERYRRARLARAGVIDTEWYRENYKDIAEAGVDPVDHYLKHGHREARLPNRRLSPKPPGAGTDDTAAQSAGNSPAEQQRGGTQPGKIASNN